MYLTDGKKENPLPLLQDVPRHWTRGRGYTLRGRSGILSGDWVSRRYCIMDNDRVNLF